MELFSLLAKLTLDTTEYDRGVSRLQGQDIDGGEVSVGLDHEEYDRGVEDVSQGSDTLGSHVGDIFEGIKGAIVAAGITAVLTQITSVIKDCVDKAATMGDEIDKGSKRLGISTRSYQVWNHALQQSGGSINDVARGMMNFRSVMNDSEEVTEAERKALEELGVTVAGKTREELRQAAKEQIQAAKSTEDHSKAIETLSSLLGDNEEEASGAAGALQELGIDPKKYATAEALMKDTLLTLADIEDIDTRDRLTEALFGRNSGGIKAMLYEGREGVKALLEEADDLGLIMSDEEIQNAVAYGDAMANLTAELDAVKTAFVADLMPVLKDAVQWLTDLLKLFNPRLRENSLSETFADIDKATTASGQRIDETSAKAQALIEKLDGMGDYWSLDSTGRKTWDTLAAEFIAIEPEFENYIDLENKKIKENTDTIKENIRQWTIREKQRLLDENTAKKREALAAQYAKVEDKLIEAEVKETDAAGKKSLAIKEVNDAIKKNDELRNAVFGAFGTTVLTDENADEILKFIHYKGFETVGMDSVEGYVKLTEEVTALREEAAKLEDEADEMAEGVEKYEAALAKRLKLTTDEVDKTTDAFRNLKRELQSMPDDVNVGINIGGSGLRMFKQAKGNWDVPYDNYPSLLHRNEMVLTASEARRYREGDTGVDLTGLRSEIVAAIREGMADATVNSYLDGQAVTDTVSRRLAAEVAGRRFG